MAGYDPFNPQPTYSSPFGDQLRQTPMAGARPYPNVIGPMNMQMPSLMQIGMYAGGGNQLLGQLMQSVGMVPGQFNPMQNLHTQQQGMNFAQQQMTAMQGASGQGAQQLTRLAEGSLRLLKGQALTTEEKDKAGQGAQLANAIMPFVTPGMGTATADALYGGNGDPRALNASLFRAGFSSIDPTTGKTGWEGKTASNVGNAVYNRLYGKGSEGVSGMHGITAGAAGELYEELKMRGLGVGGMSDKERLADLRKDMSDEDYTIAAGGDAARKKQLVEQHKEIKKKIASGASFDEVAKMPEAGDLLASGESKRISQKLKGLSGVVSAMQDIFGDMGNPNAPMREIINGLQSMTQGGLSQLAPSELERMVRTTQNLGQISGLGTEGVMALTTHASSVTDQLGGSRFSAIQAAQGGAAFNKAYDNMGVGKDPRWGQMDSTRASLMDTQLRAQASQSRAANNLNQLMRLSDQGLITNKDSEAYAAAQAVKSGKSTYSWGGKEKNVATMNYTQWKDMAKTTGMTEGELRNLYNDRQGAEEFGVKHNTQEQVRKAQTEDVGRQQGRLMTTGLMPILRDTGVTKSLGISKDKEYDFASGVSKRLGQAIAHMTRDDIRTKDTANKSFATAYKNAIVAELTSKGMSPEQAEARANKALEGMSTERIAQNVRSVSDNAIRSNRNLNGVQNTENLQTLFAPDMVASAAATKADAVAQAKMQSAMGGLGKQGLLGRITSYLSKHADGALPTWEGLVGAAMGGISTKEILEKTKGPAIAALKSSVDSAQKAERYSTDVNETAKRLAAEAKEGDWDKLSDEQKAKYTAEAKGKAGHLTAAGLQHVDEQAKFSEAVMPGGDKLEAWKKGMREQYNVKTDDELRQAMENARDAAKDPADKERLSQQVKNLENIRKPGVAAGAAAEFEAADKDETVKKAVAAAEAKEKKADAEAKAKKEAAEEKEADKQGKGDEYRAKKAAAAKEAEAKAAAGEEKAAAASGGGVAATGKAADRVAANNITISGSLDVKNMAKAIIQAQGSNHGSGAFTPGDAAQVG